MRMQAASDKHPSSADWLLVAIPGIIWGASFLFIAEGLQATAPNGVSFIRIVIGFATLSLFPGARKRIDKSAWPWILALSILWFAFPLSMFPFAEQRVSSALTGMLNATTPLFVTIVAAALARKMPARRILLGLATGIAGSVLIALPSFNEGKSSAFGVVLIVMACVSYGFALNVARPLQQRYGALPVIWRALGLAVLWTAPFGVPEIPGVALVVGAGAVADCSRRIRNQHRQCDLDGGGGPGRSHPSLGSDLPHASGGVALGSSAQA